MNATPYRMTPDVIRSVVQKYRAGAYILGDENNGQLIFRYVGRSDCCLQTRLLTHGLLYIVRILFSRTQIPQKKPLN